MTNTTTPTPTEQPTRIGHTFPPEVGALTLRELVALANREGVDPSEMLERLTAQ